MDWDRSNQTAVVDRFAERPCLNMLQTAYWAEQLYGLDELYTDERDAFTG